ncbi:hypothetical protein EBZ39_09865 [bacterium]|nr:hypothetical protein [bacterium]
MKFVVKTALAVLIGFLLVMQAHAAAKSTTTAVVWLSAADMTKLARLEAAKEAVRTTLESKAVSAHPGASAQALRVWEVEDVLWARAIGSCAANILGRLGIAFHEKELHSVFKDFVAITQDVLAQSLCEVFPLLPANELRHLPAYAAIVQAGFFYGSFIDKNHTASDDDWMDVQEGFFRDLPSYVAAGTQAPLVSHQLMRYAGLGSVLDNEEEKSPHWSMKKGVLYYLPLCEASDA